jgi:capsule synthesis protein PGA_cap
MLRAVTQILAAMLLLAGCQNSAVDPYLDWPAEGSYFPYIYTPQTDLKDYEHVRFETETWDPAVDFDMLAGYATKAIYHRPGAPVESIEHFKSMRRKIPSLAEGARLSFVGDLLWVGDNWAAFALPTAGLFDCDLRIGNLETPTSPLHTTDRSQMGLYQFNSPVDMLDGLPLDVLQLNNNHSLDFEDEALEATVAEVEKRGFVHTGYENHAIVKVKDLEIALLSYTWGINRRNITSVHELFVVPFGHIGQDIDLTALVEDIAQARTQVDSVVVLVHWGFEYEYYPDPHFMVLARAIIAAGADLVVGQGPHTLQPAEICYVNQPDKLPGQGSCSLRTGDGQPRTAAVLYSLGNFSTFQDTLPLRSGMIATVSLNPDVSGLEWLPTIMLYQPVPTVEALADHLDIWAINEESERLDDHLGTRWKRK